LPEPTTPHSPLGEIVEAHRFMESNEQIGKIVVTVDRAAD
jgi:hypothetical protein